MSVWRLVAQVLGAPVWAFVSTASSAYERTRIWPGSDAALRRRGAWPVWLDREMEWRASPSGRPGWPQALSDAAIQVCISIKVLFGLAL